LPAFHIVGPIANYVKSRLNGVGCRLALSEDLIDGHGCIINKSHSSLLLSLLLRLNAGFTLGAARAFRSRNARLALTQGSGDNAIILGKHNYVNVKNDHFRTLLRLVNFFNSASVTSIKRLLNVLFKDPLLTEFSSL